MSTTVEKQGFCIIYDVKQPGRAAFDVIQELGWQKISQEAEHRPVVIRGVFTPEQTRRLKKAVIEEFANETARQDFRYYIGCPNVHKTISQGYSHHRPEKRNLFNYFLWNKKEGHPVYEIGLPFTRIINKLADLPDDFAHDPKCGFFYTLTCMYYPKGGGYLCPHIDSYKQKYQTLLIMSELGEDFQEGGLFCFDRNNENHYLEPELKNGDLLLLPSTVVHGVYPIDPRQDGKRFEGRWAFFTPMPPVSALVESPHAAKA